ncbi:response regulator receiver protein [Mesorhizobium opportunistum WSM2075]|uniref:Response regulator receiver protein n=1 Tax=Mesorhizobium opportunistum (strain LMG 24607 / HAMBI 3007 / WSM2075) TaxID=536019 RepID=F7Y7H4_MESOW|nr:response regulator receiver protein [Mesorhizobium opportunistum WSM2075]
MPDLTGVRLLIVEDEWLLADDLAKFFGDMGAVILGPVATVERAERHTQAAEAAILDIDLKGRRVFPIADELMRRNVPFVFFSGYQDIAIPEHLRHASSLSKSASRTAVFDALFAPQSTRSGAKSKGTGSDDVLGLLPKLRLAARLLLGDVSASDRLVERTLERALDEVESKPTGQATADWLTGIMAKIARSSGSSLLH